MEKLCVLVVRRVSLMMNNWVCLDCGRDGLAITDMFTEVPMLETVDGRPVGSCQKCQDLV